MIKYLVLYEDSFLWFNLQKGIIYNCNENALLEFKCNDLIYTSCQHLNKPSNLYSLRIQNLGQDPVFNQWIENICINKLGYIDERKDCCVKPVSLPPILNLRHEIEAEESDYNSYTNPLNANSFLNEISVFLGGDISLGKRNNYHKQFLYPIEGEDILDIDALCAFFFKSNLSYVKQINVICSSVLNYPQIGYLAKVLKSFSWKVNYYMFGENVSNLEVFLSLMKNRKFCLYFFFVNKSEFIAVATWAKKHRLEHYWLFLVHNEDDLKKYEMFVLDEKVKDYHFLAVFTGSNIPFFKENVYITKSDIRKIALTKQQIFCNQVLNVNFWGQLFITPNGKIYTNLNLKAIGNMDEDLFEIISRELRHTNSSWKLVRKNIPFCNKCLFNNLCPPPSNYEFYIGQFNLCMT